MLTDPVNRGHVPAQLPTSWFRNLPKTSRLPELVIITTSPAANVDCTEISAGASANVTGLVRAEGSFEFSTTTESAAILCLPNSATRHEVLKKRAIQEYAIANGADWYAYANSRDYLAREASNGTLYLVTGCDKTDSWDLAAVGKPPHSRSVCLTFIASEVVCGEVRGAPTWSTDFSADTCDSPSSLD
ncbi:hypothetical protein F5146DRAFT_613868 [Armillaria mellea]|nr:hypothetical protein F5146DRAFT_613868 [Armillaria mellea]